jgi:hypothetical protein
LTIFVLALVGLASAKPQVLVANEVVAPYAVSQSSQYIARNFNGVAAPVVVDSPAVISAYSAYPAYTPYVF